MEIYLTPEQEAQLSQLAAQEGKGEGEVARFISAVKAGREAALRGEFVEQSEVWAGVESVLQS